MTGTFTFSPVLEAPVRGSQIGMSMFPPFSCSDTPPIHIERIYDESSRKETTLHVESGVYRLSSSSSIIAIVAVVPRLLYIMHILSGRTCAYSRSFFLCISLARLLVPYMFCRSTLSYRRYRHSSVRAYRASVRNEVYAADAAEQKAKREAEEAERRAKEKINPFSMGSSAGIGGGLGSTLFGGNADGMPSFNPFSCVAAVEAPTEAFSGLKLGSEGDQKKEKKEEKPTAPLSTPPSGPSTPPQTLAPPFPAYLPAQYLTTFDEYLPADPNALAGDTAGRVKQLSAGEAEEKERELQQQSGAGAGGKKGAAGGEQWEKVLPKGVDEVFERFLERLNRAEDGSGQVLRYDLGAVPLPYSSNSDLFKRLFKRDAGEDGVDEDDLEPDVNVFGKKYDPTGVVPNCPRCGGERTFEMQLVPGLIAELKTEHLSLTGDKKRRGGNKKKKQQTEEERRRELAVLLGRASAKDLPKPADDGEDERTTVEREEDRLRGETGMEWGTIMVFGCERDCVGFGEEWVGVEWEEMQ